MEEMLKDISPIQMFLMLAFQLWVVVIFPLIVLRKLNYLTKLIESQFEEENTDEEKV